MVSSQPSPDPILRGAKCPDKHTKKPSPQNFLSSFKGIGSNFTKFRQFSSEIRNKIITGTFDPAVDLRRISGVLADFGQHQINRAKANGLNKTVGNGASKSLDGRKFVFLASFLPVY